MRFPYLILAGLNAKEACDFVYFLGFKVMHKQDSSSKNRLTEYKHHKIR